MLSKPAPDRIPRSGEAAQSVDCVVTYIRSVNENIHLLLTGISGDSYIGNKWDGETYLKEASIAFNLYENVEFDITHFYKQYEFKYNSLYSFLFSVLIPIYRLEIFKDKAAQFLFNKQELVESDRIQTLKIILEKTIENPKYYTTVFSFPALVNTSRWIYHPDHSKQIEFTRLVLDSLVHSGDLKCCDHSKYSVTPKALITISKFETQKTQHYQNLSQARSMKYLTVALIAVGILQAVTTYVSK